MKKLLCFLAIAGVVFGTGGVVFAQRYNQTTLATNASDSALVNPWGLSRASGSPWWISNNAKGLATLYNGAGVKQGLVVVIPPADPTKTPTGSPTGTIFNGSATDFLLAPGAQALFLFSTIDGTIAGWNPGVGLAPGQTPPSTHAVTARKGESGSVYTGLTSAYIHGKLYLYAANFGKGRVDIYDSAFKPVNLNKDDGDDDSDDFAFDDDHHHGNEPFADERLPRNFVPFNVQTIGNDIVVTYVLHLDGNPVETDGPGLGYVDIYSSEGRLLRRLEHGSWLNAPWGVALAPLDFGVFSHDLLVGQFAGGGTTESSGFIAAYDLATGKFKGLLQDASGKPLAINGVWDISPGNSSPNNYDATGAPAAELYFSAGPNHGSGGLFGYLTAVPTDLVKGNNQ